MICNGVLSQEELLAVHDSGVMSPAILQFVNTIFNEAAITKLYRTVETACSIVETMVRADHAAGAAVVVLAEQNVMFVSGRASHDSCTGTPHSGAVCYSRQRGHWCRCA